MMFFRLLLKLVDFNKLIENKSTTHNNGYNSAKLMNKEKEILTLKRLISTAEKSPTYSTPKSRLRDS